jgi:hypothetical protein
MGGYKSGRAYLSPCPAIGRQIHTGASWIGSTIIRLVNVIYPIFKSAPRYALHVWFRQIYQNAMKSYTIQRSRRHYFEIFCDIHALPPFICDIAHKLEVRAFEGTEITAPWWLLGEG